MAEQVAVVEDALVIGGWRVERINEDGECRVAVFSGPGAGEDARFFAVTYGYGDDLRAELAATQQALGETAAALEALYDHETSGVCDFSWDDKAKPAHRPEWQHDRVVTLVEAALAIPDVAEALAAFKAQEGR